MLVQIDNVTLSSCWEESFNDRETHEEVKFYRALITAPGAAPMQLGVLAEDYETLASQAGGTGSAIVDIDAQPGRRVRVRLRAMN